MQNNTELATAWKRIVEIYQKDCGKALKKKLRNVKSRPDPN